MKVFTLVITAFTTKAVDGADVGMIQGRGGTSFPAATLE